MLNVTASQIGHFLSYNLWHEATRLLNFQIQEKKNNKHYNTLSIFYYEKILPIIPEVDTIDYFQRKIANNLFYGLENEFKFCDYTMPKQGLGLRYYKFFTYPARILYYSIGLYILKVSEGFIKDYIENTGNFKSYYGGKLHFKNDSLVVSSSTAFYLSHYKSFRKAVRRETSTNQENKIVIRLDIQNYFENISIINLLQKLYELVKPSTKQKLNFDTLTIEQIVFYFDWLSSNKGGIPQADNDTISGFLAHLYLSFGDLAIDEEIYKFSDFVREHKIIRYVDDTFIFIIFNDNTEEQQKELFIDLLSSRIADILHHDLGLRLNQKTKLYRLNEPNQISELLKDIKKVSPEYYVDKDNDKEEDPPNKVASIFNELRKLKLSKIDTTFRYDHSLQEEVLKDIYDKSVNQLLDKEDNQVILEEIFTNFNFDLVKAKPKELIVIIAKNHITLENFRQFLNSKKVLTSRDVDLVVKYLCQTNFTDKDLITKLEEDSNFNSVIKMYREGQVYFDFPGYYNLSNNQTFKILGESHIMEQVRLRIFHERTCLYSVALNHLLNEIHAICWFIDQPTKAEYRATDAVKYLTAQRVSHQVCIQINNLFDRRNHNVVSHPRSNQVIAWCVSKDEYFNYRNAVSMCLETIIIE